MLYDATMLGELRRMRGTGATATFPRADNNAQFKVTCNISPNGGPNPQFEI